MLDVEAVTYITVVSVDMLCFLVLSTLGEVLSLRTKWEQADEKLRQALMLQKEHLDQNHHETSRSKILCE